MSDLLKKLESGNFFSSKYLNAGRVFSNFDHDLDAKDVYDIKKEWIKYGKKYMKDHPNLDLVGSMVYGQKLVVGNTIIYQPQDLHGREYLALTATKDKIIEYIKENYDKDLPIEYFRGNID